MIYKTLKFIYNHPYNSNNKWGGVIKFFKWQINCLLNPYPVVYQYTENVKFLSWKGLAGATGNIYCGLLEYEDMSFLLHFLREEDTFFDIGANVGAYTLLASGEIKANSIAIEPVPSTFGYLADNININRLDKKVELLNIGLGNDSGTIKFTKNLDTVNHVATDNETDTIEVPIKRMDEITKKIPILIKIDVEGFETEVLNGAEKTLANPDLKAIIIELNGSGYRYGFDEKLIHKKLIDLGFKTYSYNPKNRKLTSIPTFGKYNTIYIRDESFVNERLSKAKKIKVGQIEI
ncbi:MAG: FkbM family methyltransferase [Chitinophagaceae bacterium]